MLIVPPPSSLRRRMSKPRARDSESHVPTSNTARLLCGFVSIWKLEPGLQHSFPVSPDPHHFRRTVPRRSHGFAYTRLSLWLSQFRPSLSVLPLLSLPILLLYRFHAGTSAAGSFFPSLSFLLEPVHPSRVGVVASWGSTFQCRLPSRALSVSGPRWTHRHPGRGRGGASREAIVRLPMLAWDGGSE